MSNETTGVCGLRYTGENCTIDNFQKEWLVILVGIHQLVFGMVTAFFIVWTLFGLYRKFHDKRMTFSSISFVVTIILFVENVLKMIILLDPFYYFIDYIPLPVYHIMALISNALTISAVILAYALWIEIVLHTKAMKQISNLDFKKTKTIFMISSVVTFVVFSIEFLLGTVILRNPNIFFALFYMTQVLISIPYLIIYQIFNKKIDSVVRSMKGSIEDSNKKVSLMVLIFNIGSIVGSILAVILTLTTRREEERMLPLVVALQSLIRVYETIAVYCILDLTLTSPFSRVTHTISKK
eukprot:TRINITY_DN3827_c0_g1_i1.p1 TRINITY_DN3827_c0_g1~~TRINITY_DN3827_c0_g1_i1.p1  ORF type:complete len:296 (+),score=37.78 TRINITY_DN3827_c0_g1_i1:47-934(+)